jgi:hypothetical protein
MSVWQQIPAKQFDIIYLEYLVFCQPIKRYTTSTRVCQILLRATPTVRQINLASI